MNLGIASVFGDYLNLPIARTYELYELWCFLRLVRAAAEEFGQGGVRRTDACKRGRNGCSEQGPKVLCFQKQYRELWSKQTGVDRTAAR